MKIKMIKTLLLTALFSLPCFAERGGNVSGGADYQIQVNAWFTSNQPKPVVACVDSVSDFGYNREELKQLLKKSFQKWAEYAKRVGALDQTGSCSSPQTGWLNGYYIATQLLINERCKGDEDLTVYFGVSNQNLRKRKKKYSCPFAFSELNNPPTMSSSSMQMPWSKGLIWIAPPKSVDPEVQSPLWTNYEGAALEMTLMHELGHVFGNEHQVNTIMNGDIAHDIDEKTQISQSGSPRSEFNSHHLEIDSRQFLVFRPEFGFRMALSVDGNWFCSPGDSFCFDHTKADMQFVYQRMTGNPLEGDSFSAVISHEAVIDPNSSQRSATDLLASIKINLIAGAVKTELAFTPKLILVHSSENSSFNTMCRHDLGLHQSYTLLGDLKKPDGTSVEYTLNINDSRTWVNLIDNGISATDPFCKRLAAEERGNCPVLQYDSNIN